CRDVAVVIWLLGSATGDAVAAIHGPRLERLLEKLVDSPVRGFVYESAGSIDAEVIETGGAIVKRAGETWRIPGGVMASKREEPGWARSSAALVAGLLAA